MRISEQFNPVPLIESKDYGSVGIDSDSINMGLASLVCALITFGALTGNSILKVYAGATAGAKDTALAFKYKLAGADYKAANSDLFGDWTSVTSSGLTLTAASFDHRLVVVEVDSSAMLDGKPWLTLEIDSTATALNVGAVGIAATRQGSSVTVI